MRQFNDTLRSVYARTPTEIRVRARRRGDGRTAGAIDLRLACRLPFDARSLIEFLAARAAVACCRRLLDLDADPLSVAVQLGEDPVLGALVRRRPGLRVPASVDGFELAVRAVIGQQISVASARTVAARLVERWGEPLAESVGTVTHRFPTSTALADLDPASLPMPRRIPGIGPWAASYVAMRALGDPDAYPLGDVGLRRALERLGDPAALDEERLSGAWRPWRSYAGAASPTRR